GLQRQAVQDADVWGRAMLSVETARDAGRRIYASIRPAWMRVRDLAARRRLSSVAPILAVAAVLLLTARFYYDEQRYLEKLGPKALAGFAVIGTISGSHLGLDSLVLDRNPTGFDGQFFYFIALDPTQPVICAGQPRPPRCALDEAFGVVRAERILYPYA